MKQLLMSSRRFAVAFCLLAICLAPLTLHLARAQEGGAPRVTSIQVQYAGPETVSRDRILANMRTKVGAPYSDAVVEEDIRNLYKTGDIQNVRIFGEPAGGGIRVTVVVASRPVVTEIVIDGAERISAAKLRKEIGIKIGASLSEDALEQGRQKIAELYQSKGFTGVEVAFKVEPNEKRATATVVYTINEGSKGAVREIRFEGNTAFSDRVLRKQMKTKTKTLISFLDKSGRLENQQLQQDLDSIRAWYQDHGYIDVELKDVRRERSENRLALVIPVVEGPQYHVGKVSITGQQAVTEDKVRGLLKMKPGDVYSPKGLRDDTKAIVDAYGTGGYVDLEVRPEGVPAGANTINVSYTIDEGIRSFVERVNIVGNTRTKDKVIRRELAVAPGDLFNTVRVEASKQRLNGLQYFSKVETYPEDTAIPGRKDLTVQVEEKRTGSLNFGGGFSTTDGLIGFVELTQGNFDLLNWPTFTGGGQKFRAKVQYGTQRKDIVLGLTEPYFLDYQLSLGGEAFYREANFLSSVYDQRNYGFSLEARKPINNFTSVSLGYSLQEIEIFNVNVTASPAIQEEAGSRVKSEITSSLVFDRRDNVFLTRTGQRIVFTPRIAGGFLGGDTQTYGFDLEGSQYFKLPYDTILLFNGEVAIVDTWGSGDRVPIFDRLFLGGSNNLRGFEFRDVGPRDRHGEPLGGKTLARATVEYTFPIIEKVRGAVFYDTGFVHSDAYDFGSEHIASDYGLGVRLDLPIGPLRIDYGFPLQSDGRGKGGKFNFNVGYQF